MDAKQLAKLAAEVLSGPNRLTNVRRLKGLLRAKWSLWENAWTAAGFEGRAPLVCSFNMAGQTAENDHHPVAARLLAWAESNGEAA